MRDLVKTDIPLIMARVMGAVALPGDWLTIAYRLREVAAYCEAQGHELDVALNASTPATLGTPLALPPTEGDDPGGAEGG